MLALGNFISSATNRSRSVTGEALTLFRSLGLKPLNALLLLDTLTFSNDQLQLRITLSSFLAEKTSPAHSINTYRRAISFKPNSSREFRDDVAKARVGAHDQT